MLNDGLLPLVFIDKFKDELGKMLGESLERSAVLYAHIKENPDDSSSSSVTMYLQSYDNLLQSIDEQINHYASLSLDEEQQNTLTACRKTASHLHDIKNKFEASLCQHKTLH